VIKGLEESTEDLSVSSRPNALVLFNPALVLTPLVDRPENKKQNDLRERLGAEPKEVSPVEHVTSGAPPTLILHGKADTTVPYRTAEMFTEAMEKAGNRCELAGYADQQHGFFNYGRSDNKYYQETVQRMDDFLVSLGYLKARAKKVE
jgi:acetyl esterase/lipase